MKIKECYLLDDFTGAIDACQTAFGMANLHISKQDTRIIKRMQNNLRLIAGEIFETGKFELLLDEIVGLNFQINNHRFFKPDGFKYFTNIKSLSVDECRVRVRKLERSTAKLCSKFTVRKEILDYINKSSTLLFLMACKYEK
jgi:cob(I)alamin adenosyltransferase